MADPQSGDLASVDAYIAAAPEQVRPILTEIRKAIATAVPEATEAISYQIPTFKLHGRNFMHFAAWSDHIGMYPTHRVVGDLERELAPFRTSKATARFPLDQPLPLDLIAQLAAHLAAR